MLSLTLREMRAHGRRLLGTSFAVLLGVAFLTGTLVLGDTLRRNFDTLFTDVNAGTDVVVRNATDLGIDAGEGRIPASLVDEVARVDGVETAEPVVTGFGQLLGADGEAVGGGGPPQLAGSWTTDPDLNPYRLAEGRAPEGNDEVVVNKGAADAGDLAIGDTTTLLTPEPVEVTIVGIATFGDQDGLGGVTFTAFDLDDAMAHVAKSSDQVTSISVRGDGSTSQAALAERVGEVLPSGVEASTGATVSQESTDDINELFLDMLTTTLTLFAGVALLVATFSIYNTFSIIVAQRSRQAALLRALGARRSQVLRGVVFEAVLVGVIASVVGIAAGVGIAGLLKGLFDAAGFALPAGGVVVTGGTVAVGLAVGVLVTLLAGVFPAVKASRVAPLAALREVAVERTSASRARVVVGTVLAAAGVGLSLAGALSDGDGALPLVGVGALVLVVAAVVAGPLVARPAAGRARHPGGPPAGHDRRARPRERHAQPPPHRGHRVGADGRHRRRHRVHGVRRLAEGVDGRHDRPQLRRRPGRVDGSVRRGRDQPRARRRGGGAPRGRHRGRHRPGQRPGRRVDQAAVDRRPGGPDRRARRRRDGRRPGRRRCGLGGRVDHDRRVARLGGRRRRAVHVRRRADRGPDHRRRLRQRGHGADDRRLPRAPDRVGAPHRAGRRHDGAGRPRPTA